VRRSDVVGQGHLNAMTVASTITSRTRARVAPDDRLDRDLFSELFDQA
jgi:hypothetical protein